MSRTDMLTTTLPDVSHYSYRVTWSDEDGEFVATCVEFPSLSWLAADQAEALRGMGELLRAIVHDMVEQGEVPPGPLADRHYSGKFNLRLGSDLHRRIAVAAAEEGLSINQYVVRRLIAGD